jgi:PAS domain S-box-containing protein
MTAAAPDILTLTRDARLAPYAMSAIPTWVFAGDASRVIWANASGAAALDAPSVAALSERTFSAEEPLGADIARLAETLPPTAQKYERLREVGTNLVCSCARVEIAGAPGILVIASETGRIALPLAERATRLFGASAEPLAVFSADGTLLYATGDLQPGTTLNDLGADALKADAIASGHASGESKLGLLTLDRLGSGGNTVLLATLPVAHDSADAPAEHVLEHVEADAPKIQDGLSPPITTEAESSTEPAAPIVEEPPASVDAPTVPAPGERPLRFVWTMDAQERFQLAAPPFADAMGPRTAALIGKPWREIAATLGIDPDGRVANAIASRDTWSGIVIAWPVEETSETVNVELSGLPIFDRERNFTGYRGFGMCREGARAAPQPIAAPPSPPQDEPPKDTEQRPLLTVVPAAKNVVPFRGSTPEKRPVLTPVESSAFAEIAETLKNGTPTPAAAPEAPAEPSPEREAEPAAPEAMPSAFAVAPADTGAAQRQAETQLAVLERLPVGVLIHRNEQLIYANRAFLEWTGYADLAAVAAGGGLERLVVDPQAGSLDRINGTGKTFTIATRTGDTLTCEGRLYSVPWNGESALMLVLVRTAAADRLRDSEIALRAAEAETRELRSILDTATDGVIVTDRDGLILTFNRSAEALFGYEYHEMARRPFTELFAPESERAARDYLDGLTKNGVASVLNDGREVIGRVRQGGLIPLFMTMGRIGDDTPKFCAVLRDITQWKRAEEDLLNAKRTAERASSAKSDFLAKISHEIRTPLNAIIGFSEVMMKEQFGPIGNERYREYMKDIHASGEHLVSLINDLLDLSKIEAGKLDLVFASVNLNSLVQQCVALMQPQANQQRIIIRSSLSQTLPPVVADARSVRQIVLNLLSNSIKFTGAGGQVIVSTALTDRAEAILRVRDTGIGMTDKEIETAMEPFRQLATSTRWGSGGTGLGLPLTKALAEANRAAFSIKSAVDSGTLVEITFPGTRVLAE